MILETQNFVHARMYTHSWGIPFGWADRLSCDTVLDSSVSNRASYFYMGGRTRSPDLVYGRKGTQLMRDGTNARPVLINEKPGFEKIADQCLKENRGYVAKFNSGIVNSTKYFHGLPNDKVLDVPAIKLSRCYDFCSNTVQTDFLAALVRYESAQALVIMDGHMLDIKAMFFMEKEWVSTHRMFHYQNIIWNQASSGQPWELDRYRLYAGLTRTYSRNRDGQPSGHRYYRVRMYSTDRRPREARSQYQDHRHGVTALLWHQRYLYTAGQRDWSGYPRPYFAKFNQDLSIIDAYHINTGNNYVIHNLHAGSSTGWNYRMFGLAHGNHRYTGDYFNQTYSR
jgi:hypothetical protein